MNVRKGSMNSNYGIVVICDIPTTLTMAATEHEVKEAASELLDKIQSLFSEYFPKKTWRNHIYSECKLSDLNTGRVYYEILLELHIRAKGTNEFIKSLQDL